MTRLLIPLLLSSMVAIGSAAAAPVKPTSKPGAGTKALAKPAAKKPAKPTPSKKDRAVYASLAAQKQAERLDSCDALKASISDLVPTDGFASIVEDYLGELSKRSFEKGQFETSAEFDERTRNTLGIYLGNPDRVVFELPIPRERVSYDADTEMMTVSLPTGSPVAYLPGGYGRSFLTLFEKEIDKGSTAGVTRMGVKFRYDQYIRLEKFVSIPEASIKSAADVKLKMPREEAVKRISNLSLVMLGAIEEPYAKAEDDEKVASLDSTYAQYTRSFSWYVAPRCLYVIDNKSNTVLGAFVE